MDLAAAVRLFRVPDAYFERQLEHRLASHSNGARLNELFAGADDEFWFWALTEGRRRNDGLRNVLPGLPDEQIQLTANGIAGDHALMDGFLVYRLVREIFRGLGGDLATAAVLDFGVGWGRVLRFFLRDVEADHLWGIDHYDKMIEVCNETYPPGGPRFLLNDPVPPSPFEDATFDLIFAYSVFSHLSEEAHLSWVQELARILKPGGVVVVTTWDRELIVRCGEAAASPDLPFFQAHFPSMFQPTSAWLMRYDAGQFCFDSSREAYGDISWYLGEACVSESYVRARWSEHLEVVDYVNDRSVCAQNVIVARRP